MKRGNGSDEDIGQVMNRNEGDPSRFPSHPSKAAIPDDPEEAPEPVGLWKSGHWASHLVKWVTDTGVSIRARLPFLGVLKPPGPDPAKARLSGVSQLAIGGLLAIEVVLLLGLHSATW